MINLMRLDPNKRKIMHREHELLMRQQRRPPVALVTFLDGSAVSQPLRGRQVHRLRHVETCTTDIECVSSLSIKCE